MGVITGANRSSGLGTEVTTMARGDQGGHISQSEAREGGGDQSEAGSETGADITKPHRPPAQGNGPFVYIRGRGPWGGDTGTGAPG